MEATVIGATVLYVLPAQSVRAGQVRPALVVADDNHGSVCTLAVFKASEQDFFDAAGRSLTTVGGDRQQAVALVERVQKDALGTPGTWHWQPKPV
jgi:hypothetical protein